MPRVSNIRADFVSRNVLDYTKWMLKLLVSEALWAKCLFLLYRLVIRLNVCFMVPPHGSLVGMMAFYLTGMHETYICPLFSLVSRVLNKIVVDKLENG